MHASNLKHCDNLAMIAIRQCSWTVAVFGGGQGSTRGSQYIVESLFALIPILHAITHSLGHRPWPYFKSASLPNDSLYHRTVEGRHRAAAAACARPTSWSTRQLWRVWLPMARAPSAHLRPLSPFGPLNLDLQLIQLLAKSATLSIRPIWFVFR